MGTPSMFWVICIALLVFSSEVCAARNRHWRGHGSRRFTDLAQEYADYPSSHEYLLGGAKCEIPLPPETKAPKKNIWDFLSKKESHDVQKWLMRQKELNLTSRKVEIFDVKPMTPNKTDVLRYLDEDGPEPMKYVSVQIYDSTKDVETYRYILVGPVPISNATTWQPLTYPFTRKTPVSDPILSDLNERTYSRWHRNITESIKDLLPDLFNLTRRQFDGGYGGWSWREGDRVLEWSSWSAETTQSTFDTYSLLPLPLFYGSEYDLLGNDPSSWIFKGWLYNGILYPTTAEFRAAIAEPDFEYLPPNTDGHWAWTDQKGPVLPLDSEAPPMPVAKKARFKVDNRQKYVEWMGFSFYLSFSDGAGMAFHDIRFKGERIIFELGLQEALAHYAGNDPLASNTWYLDAVYGLGAGNELMPGYDCPTYATYLNVTIAGSYSYKEVKSLCIFEFDADYPIQRHSYTSNTKNIYLVVRTISTIGNYDYMFSYEFYMDGSIQIVVRAAGYIIASYYAKNEDYGYHIHDALSGGMHDHVLNFKADFDILGTANTMQLVTVTPTTEKYVWSNQPRNTMKLVRQEIESEDESRLMWAANGATQYRIVNMDKPNRYGEYRGYRILPSQGTVHLAATNSTIMGNAANWAYYDLQITKQKDTEPKSASDLNEVDIEDPLVNFDAFFDGESLVQEDLVVWFNLGVHHVPNTGDLPNTVFTTAHSAIQIAPSNYFRYDQSRDTVNMVRLDYKYRKDTTVVKTFGQAPQICMSNLSDISYGYY